MITLYTSPTPNGWRVSILLEELGLAYEVRALDLAKGEQLAPEFQAVHPLGKIPAIVDDGLPVWGSMAALAHLAERHGALMPADPAERSQAHIWLAFAGSDLGPILVNAYYFSVRAATKMPEAIERFAGEAAKCYAALEARLAEADYLAGAAYSVADIANFPFVVAAARREGFFDRYPNLRRWHDRIAARPAVQRGMAVPRVG